MGISNLSFSATNINVGLDADKSATPKAGDMYLATDTELLYKCYTDDSWVSDELTEAKIDAAKANIAIISCVDFTGNGGTNTAVAHGLAIAPKAILMYYENDLAGFLLNGVLWSQFAAGGVSFTSVTAADDTNFYVSGTVNTNTKLYHCVAIA